ncbi:restriction endonuclease subunit S [Tetragenococcus halophilus]|nr:restriction endonuclease subunit S [Tetragenococcus halophilus]
MTYSPSNIIPEPGTFVLRSSNVKNGEVVNADDVYVTPNIVNSTNVQVGDIIVVVRNGSRNLIGKHAQIKQPMDNTVIGAFMSGIRSESSNFINALLNTDQFNKEIRKNLGATINQITTGSFKKMKFILTNNKIEQTKIGLFFKQLDDSIALHQEKLSKLQSLKKAALQFLFPKKDEIEPKARFTNFNDIWKQRKLGDVTPLRGGSAFQSSQFKKTGIPIVRISNILSDGFVGGTYAYYQEQKSDEGYVLYDGAIILAMSGATTGKVALLKDRTNKKFYQNQRVGYFTDLGIVDYSFISIVVQSFLFNVQLKTVLVAGAQPNISSKEINDFKFYFPINKKEQAKIGAFFKKLETIILLYQTKLDKLQMLKSALLQKMFI